MLASLAGSKLGVWVAHGEGKFNLPEDEDVYNIAGKYFYDEYPGNPNARITVLLRYALATDATSQ